MKIHIYSNAAFEIFDIMRMWNEAYLIRQLKQFPDEEELQEGETYFVDAINMRKVQGGIATIKNESQVTVKKI